MDAMRFRATALGGLWLVIWGCSPAPFPSDVRPVAQAQEAEVTVHYPGAHPVTGEAFGRIQDAIDAVILLTGCDGGVVRIAEGEYVQRFQIPRLADIFAQRLPAGCRLPSVRGAGSDKTRIIAEYASPPQPIGQPHVGIGAPPFFAPFGDDSFFQGGEMCCLEIVRGSNTPDFALASSWTEGVTFRDLRITGDWQTGILGSLVRRFEAERNILDGQMQFGIKIAFPGDTFADLLLGGQPGIAIRDNVVLGAEEGIRTVFTTDTTVSGNAVDATARCFFVGGSTDVRYVDNSCVHAPILPDVVGGNLRVKTARDIRWTGGCVSDAGSLLTLGFDNAGPPDGVLQWVDILYPQIGPAGDIRFQDVLIGRVAERVRDCGNPAPGGACDDSPQIERDITITGLVDDLNTECSGFIPTP